MPIDEARKLEQDLIHVAAARAIQVQTWLHEHTHHFFMMEQVHSVETQSGTVEVGGARVCGFRTGDGASAFAVIRDLDEQGRLVRIRIRPGYDEQSQRWLWEQAVGRPGPYV